MKTPTTETMRGGDMADLSGARLQNAGKLRRGPSRGLSTATIAILALLLAGCMPKSAPPPVTAIPTTAAACEALRPDMPITYSSKSDTPETVKQVRAVNARFASACP